MSIFHSSRCVLKTRSTKATSISIKATTVETSGTIRRGKYTLEISAECPARLVLASETEVAKNSHGRSLELLVDSPRYKSKRFDDIPYLDTSAALKDGVLVLNVVNRHPTQPIEVDLDLVGHQFSGPAAVSEVGGPDLKAMNDFDRSAVSIVSRSAATQGDRMRYTFPPRSYSALKVRVV